MALVKGTKEIVIETSGAEGELCGSCRFRICVRTGIVKCVLYEKILTPPSRGSSHTRRTDDCQADFQSVFSAVT